MSTELPDPKRRWSRRTRLITLLIAGVLLIGGVAVWSYYRYARPVGTGPAGPPVDAASFQKIWSKRPVVLLGLGDSVTQGLGATIGSQSYFRRLAANPPDEFSDMQGRCLAAVLPSLKPLNLAISGTTSIECVQYQLPRIPQQDAETFGIVVMTTGGNDVIHNYGRTPPREGAMYGASLDEITEWVPHFEQRLETIATTVRERFPGGCQIFVANIYDPTDGDGDIANAGLPPWPDGVKVLAAYNDALARFADRHDDVWLIDMHGAFRGHGIHCTHFWHAAYCAEDPHYWYWDNLEDPNDRGYDALRRIFLIEIARRIPDLVE